MNQRGGSFLDPGSPGLDFLPEANKRITGPVLVEVRQIPDTPWLLNLQVTNLQ